MVGTLSGVTPAARSVRRSGMIQSPTTVFRITSGLFSTIRRTTSKTSGLQGRRYSSPANLTTKGSYFLPDDRMRRMRVDSIPSQEEEAAGLHDAEGLADRRERLLIGSSPGVNDVK